MKIIKKKERKIIFLCALVILLCVVMFVMFYKDNTRVEANADYICVKNNPSKECTRTPTTKCGNWISNGDGGGGYRECTGTKYNYLYYRSTRDACASGGAVNLWVAGSSSRDTGRWTEDTYLTEDLNTYTERSCITRKEEGRVCTTKTYYRMGSAVTEQCIFYEYDTESPYGNAVQAN